METTDFFAHWYKPAGAVANLSPEQYRLRREAVDSFVESISKQQVLDLVRLFFNKPILTGNTKESLVATLQKHDESYDAKDNDFDLQILSAICLNYLLGGKPQDVTDIASLAVLTSRFTGQNESYPQEAVSQDLLNRAARYLKEESQRVRKTNKPQLSIIGSKIKVKTEDFTTYLTSNQTKPAMEHLENVLSILVTQVQGGSKSIIGAIDSLYTAVAIQEESGDIIWWLNGQYSRDLEYSYQELDIAPACLIAGKELADLTQFLPSLYAAKGILHRVLALTQANDTAVSKSKSPSGDISPTSVSIKLKDAISKIPSNWNLSWLDESNVIKVADLCPAHFGLIQRKEYGQAWVKTYEQKIGLKVSHGITSVDLAYQFYLERMLVQVSAE
jgi:hypothetical protein